MADHAEDLRQADLAKLPLFSGDKRDIFTCEQWISRVQHAKDLSGWTNARTMTYVINALIGSAFAYTRSINLASDFTSTTGTPSRPHCWTPSLPSSPSEPQRSTCQLSFKANLSASSTTTSEWLTQSTTWPPSKSSTNRGSRKTPLVPWLGPYLKLQPLALMSMPKSMWTSLTTASRIATTTLPHMYSSPAFVLTFTMKSWDNPLRPLAKPRPSPLTPKNVPPFQTQKIQALPASRYCQECNIAVLKAKINRFRGNNPSSRNTNSAPSTSAHKPPKKAPNLATKNINCQYGGRKGHFQLAGDPMVGANGVPYLQCSSAMVDSNAQAHANTATLFATTPPPRRRPRPVRIQFKSIC